MVMESVDGIVSCSAPVQMVLSSCRLNTGVEKRCLIIMCMRLTTSTGLLIRAGLQYVQLSYFVVAFLDVFIQGKDI